ncbi:hypothetical protein E2320_013300 [Naja naja]|nr:hypothetical protein E2320_013300 [Naja naja]
MDKRAQGRELWVKAPLVHHQRIPAAIPAFRQKHFQPFGAEGSKNQRYCTIVEFQARGVR